MAKDDRPGQGRIARATVKIGSAQTARPPQRRRAQGGVARPHRLGYHHLYEPEEGTGTCSRGGQLVDIAIVDDSDLDAQNICRYVDEYEREHGEGLVTYRFSDAPAFLRSSTKRFSLAIMDIDMPGINGMEAAHLLRSVNPSIQIMFVTSMPQYAIESYEVEAADYILKPVSYASFALKLSKVLRRMDRIEEGTVVLKTSEGLASVPVKDVTYVESQGHYLIYHAGPRDIRTRETMTAAERRLAPRGFARCNSYYLVNLRHISSITATDVYLGEQVLKMSRSKRAPFMEAFMSFSEGV